MNDPGPGRGAADRGRRDPGRFARGAVLALLGVAAVLAFDVTDRHYDAREEREAIYIARAHQYGPTTRARVDAWLVEERPGARAEWTAEIESSFLGRVRVTLTVRGPDGRLETWRWRVHVPSRRVEPADDATRALVERVTAWAAGG